MSGIICNLFVVFIFGFLLEELSPSVGKEPRVLTDRVVSMCVTHLLGCQVHGRRNPRGVPINDLDILDRSPLDLCEREGVFIGSSYVSIRFVIN